MRLLLLAVAATIAFLGGCGAAENDPNLAAAAARTEGSGSSRFAFETTGEGQTGDTVCSGRADYVHELLQMTCSYREGDLDVISIQDTTYLRGTLPGLLRSDMWTKFNEESFAPAFAPQRLLNDLRAASSESERIGQEQVRGAPTTRYQFEVSCAKVETIVCEGNAMTIEAWIDDDGYLRKVAFTEDSGTTAALEYFDFGSGGDIQPPPDDEVVDHS